MQGDDDCVMLSIGDEDDDHEDHEGHDNSETMSDTILTSTTEPIEKRV